MGILTTELRRQVERAMNKAPFSYEAVHLQFIIRLSVCLCTSDGLKMPK